MQGRFVEKCQCWRIRWSQQRCPSRRTYRWPPRGVHRRRLIEVGDHNQCNCCHYFPPGPWLATQPKSVIALWRPLAPNSEQLAHHWWCKADSSKNVSVGVSGGVNSAAQVDELIGDLHGVSVDVDWLRWETITNVIARYQTILFGEQRHVCVNNLPRVVTWQCTGLE